jgi:hypothetical protein
VPKVTKALLTLLAPSNIRVARKKVPETLARTCARTTRETDTYQKGKDPMSDPSIPSDIPDDDDGKLAMAMVLVACRIGQDWRPAAIVAELQRRHLCPDDAAAERALKLTLDALRLFDVTLQ